MVGHPRKIVYKWGSAQMELLVYPGKIFKVWRYDLMYGLMYGLIL
jgi:hypothetical protein